MRRHVLLPVGQRRRGRRFSLPSGVCWLIWLAACLMVAGGCNSASQRPTWKLSSWQLPTVRLPSLAPPAAPETQVAQATVPPAAATSPLPEEPTPAIDYEAGLAKGRQREQSDDDSEAEAIYRSLVQEQPRRYEAHYRLGVVADRRQRHKAAEDHYFQAIRLCRTDADVWNDLGYCFYCQGKLVKAADVLSKAIALRSEPQFHTNLGMVCGHLGRHEEALEQFRKGGGTQADACATLAAILVSRGDVDSAQRYLDQALALDPAHPRARATFDSIAAGSGGAPRHADGQVRTVPYQQREPSGIVAEQVSLNLESEESADTQDPSVARPATEGPATEPAPEGPATEGPATEPEFEASAGRPSHQTMLQRARALFRGPTAAP